MLFDYLNSINTNKKNLMVDDHTKKQYSPFMINRGMSYFIDTVMLANEMNAAHAHLDKDMQYQFYLKSVRKAKRFSKWFKADKSLVLDAIKEYYGYSYDKAVSAMSLLSEEQQATIVQKISRGGRKKPKVK